MGRIRYSDTVSELLITLLCDARNSVVLFLKLLSPEIHPAHHVKFCVIHYPSLITVETGDWDLRISELVMGYTGP